VASSAKRLGLLKPDLWLRRPRSHSCRPCDRCRILFARDQESLRTLPVARSPWPPRTAFSRTTRLDSFVRMCSNSDAGPSTPVFGQRTSSCINRMFDLRRHLHRGSFLCQAPIGHESEMNPKLLRNYLTSRLSSEPAVTGSIWGYIRSLPVSHFAISRPDVSCLARGPVGLHSKRKLEGMSPSRMRPGHRPAYPLRGRIRVIRD
jgi:hypothetical protein